MHTKTNPNKDTKRKKQVKCPLSLEYFVPHLKVYIGYVYCCASLSFKLLSSSQ